MEQFNPGFLNNFGGGNVQWWQDYIRSLLEEAHDFYEDQLQPKILVEPQKLSYEENLSPRKVKLVDGAEILDEYQKIIDEANFVDEVLESFLGRFVTWLLPKRFRWIVTDYTRVKRHNAQCDLYYEAILYFPELKQKVDIFNNSWESVMYVIEENEDYYLCWDNGDKMKHKKQRYKFDL